MSGGACYDASWPSPPAACPKTRPDPSTSTTPASTAGSVARWRRGRSRGRTRGASFVRAQPGSGAERHRALMALVACPTASIGAIPMPDARAAAAAFPEEIAPRRLRLRLHGRGVLRGVQLPAAPAGRQRARGLAAGGGAPGRAHPRAGRRALAVPHPRRRRGRPRAAVAPRFGCERILHEGDVADTARAASSGCCAETDPVALAADLTLVPVPGHTRGSTALLADDTLPLHRRPRLGLGGRPAAATRRASRLLVLVARPAPVAGAAARPPLRVGPARPRPAFPRAVRRGHAGRGRTAPPGPAGLTRAQVRGGSLLLAAGAGRTEDHLLESTISGSATAPSIGTTRWE